MENINLLFIELLSEEKGSIQSKLQVGMNQTQIVLNFVKEKEEELSKIQSENQKVTSLNLIFTDPPILKRTLCTTTGRTQLPQTNFPNQRKKCFLKDFGDS